jgi:HlyD family secretion protein
LKKHVKKIAVIVAVVVVTGVLIAAATMHGRSAAGAVTVRVEKAGQGDVIEIVSAPGTIEAKKMVQISAKVSARIVEIPFDEGQTVTKGNPDAKPPIPASVLLRLDSADLESDLRAAEAHRSSQAAQLDVAQQRNSAEEAQLAGLQVQVDDAKRDLTRQKGLLSTQDVSQAVVDTAQAKYDQLVHQLVGSQRTLIADRANLAVMRFELDAADAEIARAKETLAYTLITSPIDGIVTRVNAKVGEMVVTGTMNNPGTVILEVADLSEMIVNTRVDESAIAQVRVGQPARVHCAAYGDRVFQGVVRTVALDDTEEKDGTSYYKCEVLLKTAGERLLSGLTADVDIEVHRNSNVLNVPSQAVVERRVDELPAALRDKPEVNKNKAFAAVVYRLIDGKAVATPVTIGPSDITHTIIKSGLNSGDLVVAGPYKVLETLADGQLIKEDSATTKPSTTAPAKT